MTQKEIDILTKNELIKYEKGSFLYRHYMLSVQNTQTNGKGYRVIYIYDESEDINKQWETITAIEPPKFTKTQFTEAIISNSYKNLPQVKQDEPLLENTEQVIN